MLPFVPSFWLSAITPVRPEAWLILSIRPPHVSVAEAVKVSPLIVKLPASAPTARARNAASVAAAIAFSAMSAEPRTAFCAAVVTLTATAESEAMAEPFSVPAKGHRLNSCAIGYGSRNA